MKNIFSWLPLRLRCLLIGWLSVGCAYTIGSLSSRPRMIIPELALDRAIAFNVSAIWLYLSFFLLVPSAYFLTPRHRLQCLQSAMQLCAIVSGIIFLCFPSTMIYPEIIDTGISASVFRNFLLFDTTQNCLPSLHGALTVLSAWALWEPRTHPWRSWFCAAWAIAVLFAVIQLRRHLSIDLGCGVLLGILSGIFMARRSAHQVTLQRVYKAKQWL